MAITQDGGISGLRLRGALAAVAWATEDEG